MLPIRSPLEMAMSQMQIIISLIVLSLFPHSISIADNETFKSIPDQIRFEATLPNNSPVGHPLPLAAHWNSGQLKNGFSPEYQMRMIEAGHYLLPWFSLPDPYEQQKISYGYYENAIKKAAKLKLPITFISPQWERYLTESPLYFNLPPEKNPNVVDKRGAVLRKVSPFGPVEPWYEIGKKWTENSLAKKLQEWYPDPPLVLFLSNNEHSRLTWRELADSSRYHTKYGSGLDDNSKRKIVGDGWIERYRVLQKGMSEGLALQQWKRKSVFIGYEAFGNSAFGRWWGWLDYSLYTPGRFEPWPLAWDGASASYYVNNWNSSTDFTVMGPQIESMNWLFMLNESLKMNPDFWFEISTWDGHEPDLANDKRKYYASLGQEFNPQRYEGTVQFGMWLLRPRVVREFRNWHVTLPEAESYFLSIVRSVDRVHNDPVLRKFWRKGTLIANNGYRHPYQSSIPVEYKSAERWFLLATDLEPKRPWNLSTEIPVFSIALVIGDKPKREWLVYAHSPKFDRKNVQVTIPGYGRVKVNVTTGGCFYRVAEKSHVVTMVAGSEDRVRTSDPSCPTNLYTSSSIAENTN
jgi:hypothetical protein